MKLGSLLVGIAWLAASMGTQQTPKPAAFACPVSQPNGAAFACPVSQPNGSGEYDYKNEYLGTMLWPDGTVVFKP